MHNIQADGLVQEHKRGFKVREEDRGVRTVLPGKRGQQKRSTSLLRRHRVFLRRSDRADKRAQTLPGKSVQRRVHGDSVLLFDARSKPEFMRHGNPVYMPVFRAASKVSAHQRRDVRVAVENDHQKPVPAGAEVR